VTPAQLSRAVLTTARRLADDGELPLTPQALPERVTVEAPPRRGGGDYAVSAAFPLARAAGMAPHDIARVLRAGLAAEPGVAGVEIAGGGFLNVTLDGCGQAALVAHLIDGTEPEAGEQRDDPAADITAWSRATGDDLGALAVRTTRSSPLFLVQYAHTRARALLRAAHEAYGHEAYGHEPHAPGPYGHEPHAHEPYGPYGRRLMALLADHERVSRQVVAARHARHLEEVATAFFDFHDHAQVLPRGDEKPGAAHRARLALVGATQRVLASGLSLLGVSAPARI
jgi:arginyl-tRNA synthetase